MRIDSASARARNSVRRHARCLRCQTQSSRTLRGLLRRIRGMCIREGAQLRRSENDRCASIQPRPASQKCGLVGRRLWRFASASQAAHHKADSSAERPDMISWRLAAVRSSTARRLVPGEVRSISGQRPPQRAVSTDPTPNESTSARTHRNECTGPPPPKTSRCSSEAPLRHRRWRAYGSRRLLRAHDDCRPSRVAPRPERNGEGTALTVAPSARRGWPARVG